MRFNRREFDLASTSGDSGTWGLTAPPPCLFDCTGQQSSPGCRSLQANPPWYAAECWKELCGNSTEAASILSCLKNSCSGMYAVAQSALGGPHCLRSTATTITLPTRSTSNTVSKNIGLTSSSTDVLSSVGTVSPTPLSSLSPTSTAPDPDSSLPFRGSVRTSDLLSASGTLARADQGNFSSTGSANPGNTRTRLTPNDNSEHPTSTSSPITGATPTTSGGSPHSHATVAEIVSAVVGCILLLILIFAAYLYARRIKRCHRTDGSPNRRDDEELEKPPLDETKMDSPQTLPTTTFGLSSSGDTTVSQFNPTNTRGHSCSSPGAELEGRPLLRYSRASTALLGSSACSFMSMNREHESYMQTKALLVVDDMLAVIPSLLAQEQSMESGGSSVEECSDDSASFAGRTLTTYRNTAVSDELTMSESNLSGWHPSRMVRNAPRLASASHTHDDDASLELVSCGETVESCVSGELGMAM